MFRKYITFFALTLCLLSTLSCNYSPVFDEVREIENKQWRYNKKVRFKLNITDNKVKHDLIFNIRHTNDYKYSNIFVLFHTIGPNKKRLTERVELTLAQPDGQWLGSGNAIITCSCLVKKAYTFPLKGVYWIEIEQNMRDNPLKEITDVGLALVRTQE